MVSDLNRIYTRSTLETSCRIGEYLIAEVFDGDVEAVHERGRGDATFRELASREDLVPSHAYLWYSVAVTAQLPLLPRDIGEALPLSHHKLLLPVKDLPVKRMLARRAVERRMNKRDLAEEIKKLRQGRDGGKRRGRPPIPALVKGVRDANRALDQARAGVDADLGPDGLDADRIAEVLDGVEEMIGKLDELQRGLLEHLERARRA